MGATLAVFAAPLNRLCRLDQLFQAGELVRTLEQRQGLRIGCLEEIAFENGWIDKDQLADLGKRLAKSEYGQYLRRLAAEAS